MSLAKLSKKELLKRIQLENEKSRNRRRGESDDSDGNNSETSLSSDEESVVVRSAKKAKLATANKRSSSSKKSKSSKHRSSKYFTSSDDVESEESSKWETETETETDSSEDTKRRSKKHTKHSRQGGDRHGKKHSSKRRTRHLSESEEETDDSDNDDRDNANKVNIIFTIGGAEEDDDYDEEFDEDYMDDSEETEDEDVSVSTDDTGEYDTQSDDSCEESTDESDHIRSKRHSKVSSAKLHRKKSNEKQSHDRKYADADADANEDADTNASASNEAATTECGEDEPSSPKQNKETLLKQLKDMLLKNPKNKLIQKCVDMYSREIIKEKKKREKKEQKQKDKNMRIFRRILYDKNTNNDFGFYEKMDIDAQKRIIKELKEINKITRIEKPYRMTILESDIPVAFKAVAFKKINSLRQMEPGSGEFYKKKNWVDTFMKIPFGQYCSLPISIENGVDSCHDFMENAQKTLEQAVYGLNDAKMQIMQMLGQLLTNPKSIGTAIAIHGPPGTGKTSLVREGISKILNRPFAFIALGGATDSSFLEGHGYTYEGSTWGRIVQILIDSKCMNPVIYFDELDKISETPRGEEIAGILTHLTDTSQNTQFHDKYFDEVDFDLSKCLFIFSYNDESKVNPILRDRMYRIKTNGYSVKEKIVIANQYLMPKIREQVRFKDEEIVITDSVLGYIHENYCHREDGVRNMKRCLEIIHTKLNLYRLMKPNTNLFKENMSLKVEFPFQVTREVVDKLIKRESDGNEAWRSMMI